MWVVRFYPFHNSPYTAIAVKDVVQTSWMRPVLKRRMNYMKYSMKNFAKKVSILKQVNSVQ